MCRRSLRKAINQRQSARRAAPSGGSPGAGSGGIWGGGDWRETTVDGRGHDIFLREQMIDLTAKAELLTLAMAFTAAHGRSSEV